MSEPETVTVGGEPTTVPTYFINGCTGTPEDPHPRVYYFGDVKLDLKDMPEWKGHCPVCVTLEMIADGVEAGLEAAKASLMSWGEELKK